MNYAWGSPDLIPQLMDAVPSSQPVAEVWMGAHPASPSSIELEGRSVDLNQFIASNPEYALGVTTGDGGDSTLPFMMKLLAADSPLSLQVHPTRADAEDGFRREELAQVALDDPSRCYRDRSHKPEMLYALGPFELMAGFRPPRQILEVLGGLDPLALGPVMRALGHPDPGVALRDGFAAALEMAPTSVAYLVDSLIEKTRHRGPCRPEYELMTRLAVAHPADVGVVAAAFLHHVVLAPGEAVFLPAGVVHSYVRGLGVEVMATSDNVLRAGLTSKYVSVPEVLRTVHFAVGSPDLLVPVSNRRSGVFTPPTTEFSLWVYRAADSDLERDAHLLPGPGSGPRIVVSCGSPVEIISGGQCLTLEPGRAAFVPDADGTLSLRSVGTVAIACLPQ